MGLVELAVEHQQTETILCLALLRQQAVAKAAATILVPLTAVVLAAVETMRLPPAPLAHQDKATTAEISSVAPVLAVLAELAEAALVPPAKTQQRTPEATEETAQRRLSPAHR